MNSTKRIEIVETKEMLARRGADIFCAKAVESIEKEGHFTVAMSGGSTPRQMNKLLATKAYSSKIDWERVDIFQVDERLVPHTHPDSNFGALQEDLLNSIEIPQENIHPMPINLPPEEGAEIYEEELKRYFQGREPRFNLILLGLGEDGHTASIFPNTTIEKDDPKWVRLVEGGNPFLKRLTMTYTLLNQSTESIFLVTGESKRDIVKKIIEENRGIYPAENIKVVNGNPLWLLDKTSSSRLSKL